MSENIDSNVTARPSYRGLTRKQLRAAEALLALHPAGVARFAELRIKIRSLADEQTTIRRTEERYRAAARALRKVSKGDAPPGREPFKGSDCGALLALAERSFWSLRVHRGELRSESRSAMLALAFLRGRPYSEVEAVARVAPEWARVHRIAVSFGGDGGPEMLARWREWLRAAEAHHREGLKVLRARELAKQG